MTTDGDAEISDPLVRTDHALGIELELILVDAALASGDCREPQAWKDVICGDGVDAADALELQLA